MSKSITANMNIRTRLKISNLLMIIVPVVIAAVAGVVAVAAAWSVLSHGAGIGANDSEDFFEASNVVAASAVPMLGEGAAEELAQASHLNQMLDASDMSLAVLVDGVSVYSYGDFSTRDEELLSAVGAVEGDVELSNAGRCLNMKNVTADGVTYQLCLMGDARSGSELVTESVVVAAAAVLVVVLVVTVLLTSRFLTLFVLRHITEPLDQLARGTRKIRDGDLSFRLPTDRTDEFAPVFADFNDMARRLSDSVERDRRAEERRSTLIVGLSHDLRSPLTSIQAYAEGLLDGVAADKATGERYLRMIKQKAEEMGNLLKRLSQVAKLNRSADAGLLERVRLDELVGGWIRENEDAYKLRGVSIEARLDRAEAVVDPELVQRSLANLLDNCARYARGESGSCWVVLSCRMREYGEGAVGEAEEAEGVEAAAGAGPDVGEAVHASRVVLAVDDDGPGVAEEELAHLFDLFYRGDAARSATDEGNGIGLAVVALSAEHMGAEARAARSSLGGLRVEIVFPPCADPAGLVEPAGSANPAKLVGSADPAEEESL